MPEDYRSAALRHYTDAEMLAEQKRYDNAGHLLGFAGECAIKSAIMAYSGTQPEHEHFPKLVDVARKKFNNMRDSCMRLALSNDVFSGWRVEQRYDSTDTIDILSYEAWRRDARRLMGAAGLKQG